MPDIDIKRVPLQDVLQLRHEVLRFAASPESSILPGDRDSTTTHFGLFSDQVLIGVASLLKEQLPEHPGTAYRIRAMAVSAERQSQGIGTCLINAIINTAHESNATYIWCTVRPDAEHFYGKFGFKKDDVKVEMPHGEFSRMVLQLT